MLILNIVGVLYSLLLFTYNLEVDKILFTLSKTGQVIIRISTTRQVLTKMSKIGQVLIMIGVTGQCISR